MAKRSRTSVEFTKITEPILRELKLGGWDYTESINAGIVAFSQLTGEQKNFFRASAYGMESEHNDNAREIFHKWILELVADALAAHPELIKDLLKTPQPSEDYDINDPDACIAHVDAETKKRVAAEDKKRHGHTKSAG
jgi:hypothetical protein